MNSKFVITLNRYGLQCTSANIDAILATPTTNNYVYMYKLQKCIFAKIVIATKVHHRHLLYECGGLLQRGV